MVKIRERILVYLMLILVVVVKNLFLISDFRDVYFLNSVSALAVASFVDSLLVISFGEVLRYSIESE